MTGPLSSERRLRALAASVEAGEARRRADRSVDWDTVIARFKRDMKRRYRGAPKGGFTDGEKQ
jgi:hypothetical protein